MKSSQAQQEQMKQQEQGRRVVVGKVTDMRQVKLKGQAGDEHRLLKLSANNNTVIVDLGPMKDEAFKQLNIKQGSRIWALGSSARINDKPVVFARYVGEVYDFKPNYQGGQRPS